MNDNINTGGITRLRHGQYLGGEARRGEERRGEESAACIQKQSEILAKILLFIGSPETEKETNKKKK